MTHLMHSARRFMLAGLLAFTGALVPAMAETSPVVPLPQSVSYKKGAFPIDATRTEIVADDAFAFEIAQIAAEYEAIGGARPEAAKPALVISLKLDDSEKEKLGAEGYRLDVTPKGIAITGPAKAGVFYGVQTLKQLLRAHAAKGAIPAQTISDWPGLEFRGVMDDISRGPVPTMAFMRQQIERLSELKFNRLSYYSEHIIRTLSHPEVAPADGGITIADLEALVAYARQHHIMLVGNLQSFGHFEKSLMHPGVRPLGEGDRMISPVLPEARHYLSEMLGEVVPVFDAPYFNINSDETFDLGTGYSKLAADAKGKGAVYAAHVNWLHDQLTGMGKRMMLWADIVAEHPEMMADIPKDTIMMPWNYDADFDFVGMIAPLKREGYDVIVTAGILNSYRIAPDLEMARQNLDKFLKAGADADVMGAWTTVWDDGGMALFNHDWYGLAYAADRSWQPAAAVDRKGFEARLMAGVYGSPDAPFVAALERLYAVTNVAPTAGFNDLPIWRAALPERGQAGRVATEGWPEVKEIAKETGALLDSVTLKRYPADAEVYRFTAKLYRTLAGSRLAALDAAADYARASRRQWEDRIDARAGLVEAVEKLSKVERDWRTLQGWYEGLWLRENHTSTLDHVLDRYQAQIDRWADAHRRVKQALRDFDMGNTLPAPLDVRLEISPLSGQYFMGWLELGTFPVAKGEKAVDIDYMATNGGEKAARPKVTETIVEKGRKYRWRRILANASDVVDLAAMNPSAPEQAVHYEFAEVTSPDDRLVKAKVSSTGSMAVYLNGELVYRHEGSRPLVIDEDTIPINLKAGKNALMVKLVREGADWQFTFKLPDNQVATSKNRYRIKD
ncbi:beta-N-acetylhexosaminidase [Pseudokordiimonas caeni]|uniref:beta-N-acetylhexosaminidase n=1 Tax=Pseudokordiimonas caeni TaxID=2997908 RepID=UPI00281129AC|nr:beta-N-acetylhexosaminidase [Pseudokordiimonas caeni]